LNISQAALAKAIASHQSTVAAYESGARTPTAIHAKELCRILNLKPPELILPPSVLGFCPSKTCPNNIRCIVNGFLVVIPVLVDAAVSHCQYCGTIIKKEIENGEISDKLLVHSPTSGEPYIDPGDIIFGDKEVTREEFFKLIEEAHSITKEVETEE
jgi:transcriptional regulator with XRE-family HTH domain